MKIVHVAQFLGVGGLEKIIFHLACEQKALGHEVSVYVYDHERSWVPFFRSNGINVITPPPKQQGYDLQLLMRLNRILRDVDVVHTHDLNPLMYLGPVTLLKRILFKKNYRLIHTTHGIDHVRHSPKIRYYEKLASGLADNVVAVSERIAQFYRDDVRLAHNKLNLIPNGIKTYQYQISDQLRQEKKDWLCKRHGLDCTRPVVLALSRVVPLKDQMFLIRCFKQRPQYQLLIAGPSGDDKYYQLLKNEEDNNIKIIGAQEMVSDYNLGSDLYVSASTSEGIPVAVLEAMAVETPCLVSDIPGHRTINNHGAFVDLFQLGDLSGFLEKCDYWLGHKEQADAIAAKSRSTVEDFFSVKNMVKSYIEIYQA